MAVPDNISIFTGGWFQSDGEVPDQIEIFSDGWFNVLIAVTGLARVAFSYKAAALAFSSKSAGLAFSSLKAGVAFTEE